VTLEARSAIPEREEILNESYAKCCGKIEQAFQFYARILDNIKAELLSSLEKNKEEKQEYLNTLYQKIDKQTNLLHDALGFLLALPMGGLDIF
jgi:ABC-type phosphate transport system auxiliary subunit